MRSQGTAESGVNYEQDERRGQRFRMEFVERDVASSGGDQKRAGQEQRRG